MVCIQILSVNNLFKQQILLNKNTFSFLQEGTKEVFFDNSSYAINNSQFLLMKSGNCLMTEKLSNVEEYYRSVLLFFSKKSTIPDTKGCSGPTIINSIFSFKI